MTSFDSALSVPQEDLTIELRPGRRLPWADFLLNPRRLRGSDFLMRWSQGQWSEERLIQAVNETGAYFALPYGPSGTAPDSDVREFELYFERLERAGLGKLKRPDMLIFSAKNEGRARKIVESLGGKEELPFTPEGELRMRSLLEMAFLAIECENSLWKAKAMPDFGSQLTPQRRLGGRLGLKKSAVVPTVIIKEEDRSPLQQWQKQRSIPVHVWHVFYDMAVGISLDEADRLIAAGLIEPTEQVFQAPGGATTKKVIYKIYYQYAYELGASTSEPTLVADYIADKNGRILPYVRFQGGSLEIAAEAVDVLRRASEGK